MRYCRINAFYAVGAQTIGGRATYVAAANDRALAPVLIVVGGVVDDNVKNRTVTVARSRYVLAIVVSVGSNRIDDIVTAVSSVTSELDSTSYPCPLLVGIGDGGTAVVYMAATLTQWKSDCDFGPMPFVSACPSALTLTNASVTANAPVFFVIPRNDNEFNRTFVEYYNRTIQQETSTRWQSQLTVYPNTSTGFMTSNASTDQLAKQQAIKDILDWGSRTAVMA